MASDTLTYVPGRTLGRSGYVPSNTDKLFEKIEHLDALLSMISVSATGTLEGEELEGFWNCNRHIQMAVMHLASTLATEIHELNEERHVEEINTSRKGAAPWAGHKSNV